MCFFCFFVVFFLSVLYHCLIVLCIIYAVTLVKIDTELYGCKDDVEMLKL